MNTQSQRPRGKRKTQNPCEGCGLHRLLCLCDQIPILNLKTRVSLVIHAREMKRTSNTGLLGLKALTNSQFFIRGLPGKPLDLSSLVNSEYRPLLLYPSEDAIPLSPELVQQSPLPIHLIVPDGNWRQASKVHYRHSELKHIPRVMINSPNLEQRRLRAETTETGMATLQAMAYALGAIEGEDVQKELLKLYHLKLERTLKARGASGNADSNLSE